MSSKWIALIFLIVSNVTLVSCDWPLHEEPPATEPIVVGLDGATACLSSVMPVMEKYFEGTANNAEVIAAWDCMNTAITTFEKSTQGRYEDRFTARELAHFIEQYFLEKGSRIPNPLLEEIFRIKQLFVGGEINSLTREEMKTLRSVLGDLKRLTLQLNPHMKILSLHWAPRGPRMREADIDVFESANSAIQQAANDLATVIEKNGLPYRLDNVLALLQELSRFSRKTWPWLGKVEKVMPVVAKLKKALTGGDPLEISPTEWRRFALLGARGYVQYLRYYYFIQSADLTAGGMELTYFTRALDDLFSLLGDTVGGKPGQSLTRAEILDILQSVSEFVPKLKVSEALLNEAMKLKVVFFGGSQDGFVKTDFDRARSKLEPFRSVAEKYFAYSTVYSLKWKPNAGSSRSSRDYFKVAESSLMDIAGTLGSLMESSYDLQDLIKLAEQVDHMDPSNPQNLQGAAAQYVPVVVAIKNIAFADQGSVVGQKPSSVSAQWGLLLRTSAELYSRFMYYTYFVKDESLTVEPGLSSIFRLVSDSSIALDHLIQSKYGEKLLSLHQITHLMETVKQAGFKVNVSEGLLVEAMKLKVVFFGGQTESFVKSDLDKIRSKLDSFQNITQKYLTYSSVYDLSWKAPLGSSQDYFQAAEINLRDLGEKLGALMENPYDLRDLIKLAEQLDSMNSSARKSMKETAAQYVPVIVAFKNILFSDQGSVVGQRSPQVSAQWGLLFKTATELYSRFLYYSYFVKDQSLMAEPGLSFFQRLVVDSTFFLDHLLQSKYGNQLVSFQEMNRLIGAVKEADLLTVGLSENTLNGLIKVVIQKVLIPPEDRLAGRIPAGLTTVATEVLRNEFSLWLDSQKFLSATYQGVPENTGKPSAALVAALDSAAPTNSLTELKMIFKGPLPLSFDTVGRLFLSKPALNYRKSTADTINIVRSATRVVIRSYAMNLSRINSYQGITKDEANALYADLKPLVVELELMSSDDKEFANNRFRDANLFTAVGNGDDLADFKEMSNLFVMILSGIKIDSLMFEHVQKLCPLQKPTTVKADWIVKMDCLVPNYAKAMPTEFASMPDFLKFQASLPADRFQAMFIGLLKATGAVISEQGDVKIGDLALFPHIVQYVEGIYQVYDLDRNGELTTPEALKAFPTYKPILQQVSGLTADQDLKGLFTWLLKYGKPPQTFTEKIKFKTWWVPLGESGWDINANRETLAKILGFIADALNSGTGSGILTMDLRDVAEGIPSATQDLSH